MTAGNRHLPDKFRLNQEGLTLAELLITLAIVAFVGLAIFELLSGLLNDWSRTASSSVVMTEVNTALSSLGKDIRLAQNPNAKTRAVVVKSPSSMDVYHYDSSTKIYRQISYLVESVSVNGKTTYALKRGTIDTSTPGSDPNPQFGTISSWRVLLNGLANNNVFTDQTTDPDTNDRRRVDINLSVSDIINTPAKFADLHFENTFMSRSQQVGSLGGEGGLTTIAVTGVSATTSKSTLNLGKSETTFTATASINPSNATNQNLTWSSNALWITILDDPTQHSILVSVSAYKGSSFRIGIITVTTEDGGHTYNILVIQTK